MSGRWLLAALIAAECVAAVVSATQAPRPRLGIIYPGGESTGPAELRRAIEPLGVDLAIFAPGSGGESLSQDTDLSAFDVLLIDGTTTGLLQHGPQIAAARARTKVVVIDPGDVAGNVPLASHPEIATYWANQSQDNYANLARYLVEVVAGKAALRGVRAAPVTYPAQGFYHPDAPALFPTLDAYLAWYRSREARNGAHVFRPEQLTLGIYFHLAAYQQKNADPVDAIVRAVEQRGHNAIALAFRSNPDLRAFLAADRPAVDALVFAGSLLHLKDRPAGIADARTLNVPILGAMNHASFSAAEFARSATGLHPSLTPAVVDAEQEGRIEPIVISGRGGRNGDRAFVEPFAAQVEWRVERALAWARLHRAANHDKRVVFTYWSEGGGKANVGGDPDDFLDVPATLVRLLGQMRDRGYDLGPTALPDRDALTRRMSLSASNVGTWAPGELAARVQRGEVTLLPEETYRAWFDALPEVRRTEIETAWGPPPGKVMVYTDASGRRSLVIPGITFGNVLLAPHPDWGYLQDAKALMSTGQLPPHHQYLAFFLWLQRQWKADAWVSLFTNISLQPGKAEGPAVDEHIGILLGAIPHIHPERLGANGGPGNKRKTLAQTAGWYNIVGYSDESEKYLALRAMLGRYAQPADPKLRAESETLIRREIVRSGLSDAIDGDVTTKPFAELTKDVSTYLDALERALSPTGSKILGDAPTGVAMTDMVTAMLGSELRSALDALAGAPIDPRPLVAKVLAGAPPNDVLRTAIGRTAAGAESQLLRAANYADRLRTAPRETSAILAALEARFIEPGPLDDPVRKPDALPPGRSLFSFDQAAIPTPEAEALGVKQAEAMIAAHRGKNAGAYPTKLAFVIWSSEIAKNNGVTEAEILHLLGTRVVRNDRGEVSGVTLISRAELGRPRVDVLATTSGTYRDHYQDKVDLIAEAARLAAESPEADNPVAAGTRATERNLRDRGEAPERAAALARARVFSPAAGAYSPNIQFLAKSGDQRGDESRMAELYTSRLSHAYGAGLYGESARSAFEQNLGRVDSATLPRSGDVNGLLDEPMPAGFLGGLNLAARAVTGKDVDLYVSDLRDASRPSITTAAQALQAELRTRYLNAAWLKQMQEHGYDGARNMMFLTDNLDLWDTTAASTVSSDDWADVKAVYVEDKHGLGMDAFFDRYNPHAQQVLLANLLGAASRGQWNASREDLVRVASRLAQSAADHGAVCEASICRNPALTNYVESALAGAPGGARLAAQYARAIDRARGVDSAPAHSTTAASASTAGAMGTAPAMAPPTVAGRVLEESSVPAAVISGPPRSTAALWLLAGLALGLFGVGFVRSGR